MNPKIVIAKFGESSFGFNKEVEIALLQPIAIVIIVTQPYVLLPRTINPMKQHAGIKWAVMDRLIRCVVKCVSCLVATSRKNLQKIKNPFLTMYGFNNFFIKIKSPKAPNATAMGNRKSYGMLLKMPVIAIFKL